MWRFLTKSRSDVAHADDNFDLLEVAARIFWTSDFSRWRERGLLHPVGNFVCCGGAALGAYAATLAQRIGKPGDATGDGANRGFLELGFGVGLPVGDKDVGLAARLAVAIAGKDQLFAVGRKHRKAVKVGGVGDAL